MTLEEFTFQIESILEQHKAQRVEDFDYVPDVKTITSKNITLEDWNTIVAAIENVVTNNNTISDTTIALFELFKQYPDTVFPEFRKLLQEFVDELDITVDTSTLATKEDLQNVIEIAEGKTKSYLLSCNDVIQEDFLPYMTYYNAYGEVLTSEQVMNIVNNGTCVNNLFNSQDNQVPVWDVSNWYLIIEYNYPVTQNNSKVIITNMDNPFKQGDILIVTETDVPDRYATDIGIFYKMETAKVDLSTVVHKTGDEEISGVKTFSSGIKLAQGGNIGTTGDGGDITFTIGNGNSIRPTWSGHYNLGSSGYRWKDLYLGGKIDFGTQYNVSVKMLNDDLIIDRGGVNVFSIGTNSGQTKTWYNFVPATNGGADLGRSANQWKDLYLSGEIKSNGVAQYKKVQCLTQDEYDALSTKDENVLYLIKE